MLGQVSPTLHPRPKPALSLPPCLVHNVYACYMMCAYVYIFVIYIYIYIEREREIDR